MPSINLRLTEEEHAALERWAKDGHRSLQKQIIWMLFSGEHEVEDIRIGIAKTKTKELQDAIQAGESSYAAEKGYPDPHFKPDFK